MGVIESIARLLDVQRALNLMPIKAGIMLTRGIPTGSTKKSSLTPVQHLRICSSCYDVLIALLEYDGHLQDVEDKVSKIFCFILVDFQISYGPKTQESLAIYSSSTYFIQVMATSCERSQLVTKSLISRCSFAFIYIVTCIILISTRK